MSTSLSDLEKKFLEYYLGVGGSLSDLWSAFYLAGLAGTASSVNIDGGTIDGTTLGSTTPAAGAFTTLNATGLTGISTLLSGATANFTDFPRTQVVISTANTGVTEPGIHALICEAKSDGTYNSCGLDGYGAANGAGAGMGVHAIGRVTATTDSGGAFGIYATSNMTHAGGINYGVYSDASNGATNYSFYGAQGTLYNAGGINSTPIGNITPSTGVFTTLGASSDITLGTAAGNDYIIKPGTSTATGSLMIQAGAGSNMYGGGLTLFAHSHATYPGDVVAGISSTSGGRFRVNSNGIAGGGTDWAVVSSTGLVVTGAISATTTIKTQGYTVATLPAGSTGMRAYVTDATTPTWNAALTGGGAVVCPVFYNGTAWVSA